MRVLGIDPGSRYLGYGVVDGLGTRVAHVAHGVVVAGDKAPLQTRLLTIHAALTEVIALHRPDAVAVEGVFTHKNARSALVLGHARGVALLLAAQADLPLFEYAPAQVKRAVGAGGGESKGAVSRMVTRLLQLALAPERSDASDALAVALCHLNRVRAPQAVPHGQKARALPDFASRLSAAFVPARKSAS